MSVSVYFGSPNFSPCYMYKLVLCGVRNALRNGVLDMEAHSSGPDGPDKRNCTARMHVAKFSVSIKI